MYGTWSLWSDCDRSCGGGARVRSRSCTNPPPQFGGSDCSLLGLVQETQICNMMACPGKRTCFVFYLSRRKVVFSDFATVVGLNKNIPCSTSSVLYALLHCQILTFRLFSPSEF